MDKKELRKQVSLLQKEFLSSVGADSLCRQLWNTVENMPEFKSASNVLAYASLPDEIPTKDFILRWNGEKNIVLPVVKGDELELRSFSPDKLIAGYRGIMEPSDESKLVSPDEIDFAIIPGVAFTPSGMRLGRGGGFYDRFMGHLKCIKVSLALPCQIVDDIPADNWDLYVDKVVSLQDCI